MRIVDSHTHLDFNDFTKDRNEVIQRAINHGINDLIVSATTADRWHLIKQLCAEQKSICHPAYGLHPMFMQVHNVEKDLLKLEDWLIENKAVAISEIGLDFFIEEADEKNRKAQEELFVSQCDIANSHKLPVIIHARKSLDIVLKHLRRFPNLKGSIHSFSGSEQQARQLIDLGFYLSFGGPITYSRAVRLHKLIQNIPLESLLVETDSPDQPDSNHHLERNEPAFIIHVIKKIADLKKIETEQVAKETSKNAIELFNLDPI